MNYPVTRLDGGIVIISKKNNDGLYTEIKFPIDWFDKFMEHVVYVHDNAVSQGIIEPLIDSSWMRNN